MPGKTPLKHMYLVHGENSLSFTHPAAAIRDISTLSLMKWSSFLPSATAKKRQTIIDMVYKVQ